MEQKRGNFLLLHSMAESYTIKYKKKQRGVNQNLHLKTTLTLVEEHEVEK